MVHKPLLSEMSETSAWNPASYPQWCIAPACICSFICLLLFGAVSCFDTFHFYWLKNNVIVNKNRMRQLPSQEKHFRKGAVISLCLLNCASWICMNILVKLHDCLHECSGDNLGPSASHRSHQGQIVTRADSWLVSYVLCYCESAAVGRCYKSQRVIAALPSPAFCSLFILYCSWSFLEANWVLPLTTLLEVCCSNQSLLPVNNPNFLS